MVPGWPLMRKNNWIEPNVHLMWMWEQTGILTLGLFCWLSFFLLPDQLNLTWNWGWDRLIILSKTYFKPPSTCSSTLGKYTPLFFIIIIVVWRQSITSSFPFLKFCSTINSELVRLQRCFYQSKDGHRACVFTCNLPRLSAQAQCILSKQSNRKYSQSVTGNEMISFCVTVLFVLLIRINTTAVLSIIISWYMMLRRRNISNYINS